MKATEAKSAAILYNNTFNRDELDVIYGKIKEASRTGEFSIECNISENIIPIITSDGYSVERLFNLRTKISWND